MLATKATPLADRIRNKWAQARIELDRKSPRMYEPIAFSLELGDADLQLIAPQSGLLPVWTFTDPEAKILEWAPTRYFLPPRPRWNDGKVWQRFTGEFRRWWNGEPEPRIDRSVEVSLEGKSVAKLTMSMRGIPPRREKNLKPLVLLVATVLPVLVAVVWQATDFSPVTLFTLGFATDRVKETLTGA